MSYTPGPWELYKRQSGTCVVYVPAKSDSRRERFYNGVWIHEGESEANARLIAAAPGLSDALLTAPSIPEGFFGDEWSNEDRLKWMCDYADWLREIRGPALAKAEGKP